MPNKIEATLHQTTGPIFVERNGERIELNVGDGIYESDVIITGNNTTADILYRDGTKSRLAPDTELKLVDFEFGEGDEDPSFVAELAKGAMRTVTGEIVKLNPESFEVITPRGTAGIRGTEFTVSISNDGGVTFTTLHITKTMVVTGVDGNQSILNAPLQLVAIDVAGNTVATQQLSYEAMTEVLQAIAPSIASAIPTNAQEQGDWWNQQIESDASEAQEEAEGEETTEADAVIVNSSLTDDEIVGIIDEIAANDVLNDSGAASADGTSDVLDTPEFDTDEEIATGPTDSTDNVLVLEEDGEVIIPIEVIEFMGGFGYNENNSLLPSAGNRTIIVNGDVTVPFSANASRIDSSTQLEDNLITNVTAGNIIVISGSVNNIFVSGDVMNVKLDNTQRIILGDDTITINTSVESGGQVFGDAEKIDGYGNITFGNDKITVNTLKGTIYGDFVSQDSGSGTITFGNDTITVDNLDGTGKIYGDASTSTASGGDDTITVNKFTGGQIYGGDGNDKFYINANDSSDANLTIEDFNIVDGNKDTIFIKGASQIESGDVVWSSGANLKIMVDGTASITIVGVKNFSGFNIYENNAFAAYQQLVTLNQIADW